MREIIQNLKQSLTERFFKEGDETEPLPYWETMLVAEDTVKKLEDVLPYLAPQEIGAILLGNLLDENESILTDNNISSLIDLVKSLHTENPSLSLPDYLFTPHDQVTSLRSHYFQSFLYTLKKMVDVTPSQQLQSTAIFLQEASLPFLIGRDDPLSPNILLQAKKTLKTIGHDDMFPVLRPALKLAIPLACATFLALAHGRTQEKHILALSYTPNGHTTLAFFDVEGQALTEIREKKYISLEYPVWSPDGTTLAYVERENYFDVQIVIWNIETQEIQKIPIDGYMYEGPSWTPDHKLLTSFYSLKKSSCHIFKIDPKTQEFEDLDIGTNPQASPDGKWIAFELRGSSPVGRGFGGNHVWIMKSDGSQRQVIAMGLTTAGPAWSSNNRLAFQGGYGWENNIYEFDPKTGEILNITNTPNTREHSPAWSPDGMKLAYIADTSTPEPIIIHTLENGHIEYIQGNFYPHSVTFSPDGKYLAAIIYTYIQPPQLAVFPTTSPDQMIFIDKSSSVSWK